MFGVDVGGVRVGAVLCICYVNYCCLCWLLLLVSVVGVHDGSCVLMLLRAFVLGVIECVGVRVHCGCCWCLLLVFVVVVLMLLFV